MRKALEYLLDHGFTIVAAAIFIAGFLWALLSNMEGEVQDKFDEFEFPSSMGEVEIQYNQDLFVV